MTMHVLPFAIFWFSILIGCRTTFAISGWAWEDGFLFRRIYRYLIDLIVFLALIVSLMAIGNWAWVNPAKNDAKSEFYGTPIINQAENLEGKVFVPQAFVVTGKHILVYDKDGKVYSL